MLLSVTKAVKTAIALAIVMIFLTYPGVVAGSNLDYVWGYLPGIIIAREYVGENEQLPPGTWFAVVYRVAVKKWPWESESTVLQRVREYFANIYEKWTAEHPELEPPIYASFKCVNIVDRILWKEYVYDVEIVSKVKEHQYMVAREELIAPAVIAAIIIGLILATIIATIILVQQPAVQKLLISTGEAISSYPIILPLALGLGIMVLIIVIIVTTKRG